MAGTIRASCGTGSSGSRDLGSHALVYLLVGGGEYGDALGRRQRVRAGDLIWLFPGVAHAYGPAEGGRWDEIYLVFDGPLVDLWRAQKIVTPERPVWRLEPVEFWYRRLEAVALAPASAGPGDAFQQLSQFQVLVADMFQASRAAAGGEADHAWLANACRYLDRMGPSAPGLEEVARLVGMSYGNFRRKFAERMGTAPAKYRQARVIERACRLLMQRSHSHREIAEQTGFYDEFHFSKTFRKVVGIPPHLFRLKALGSAPK